MNNPAVESPAFAKALSIIGQSPMPDDAEAQLQQLRKHIHPDERPMFADIMTSFRLVSGAQDQNSPSLRKGAKT